MIYNPKFLEEIVITEEDLEKIVNKNGYTYTSKPREERSGLKHILFLGYDKRETNKFYFITLTTKRKNSKSQTLIREVNGRQIFANTNSIYSCNFDELSDIKFKMNNKFYWNFKISIISSLSIKKLKFLKDNTNMRIYQQEYTLKKSNKDITKKMKQSIF